LLGNGSQPQLAIGSRKSRSASRLAAGSTNGSEIEIVDQRIRQNNESSSTSKVCAAVIQLVVIMEWPV
jgi:hypothetical protein